MKDKSLTYDRENASASEVYDEPYSLFFDHSPLPMWIHDLETNRVLAVNHAAVRRFGYSMEEFKAMTVEVIYAPEELARSAENSEPNSDGWEEARMRRLVKKDGSFMYAETFSSTLPFEGREAGWVVAIDVTKQTRAEDALLLSNQRVIDILESMQDGFFTVNRDWRFTYINRHAAETVGYQPNELIGQVLWEKFPEMLGTAHESHYRKVMEDKTPLDFEVSGALSSGTYDIRVHPAPDGISVYWIDITRRKRDEEEIRQLNQDLKHRADELETANKELEAFAYSVSHDLRAPLRHLVGFVELLLKDAPALDEKNKRYLNIVSNSARRMGTLVDDLLNFSRMGRVEMHRMAVDLEDVAQEAIHDLGAGISGRDVLLQVGSLPPAFGDRSMFYLIFTNLIGNALKFTRPRARAKIEIGALPPKMEAVEGEASQEVVYFVRDNGVGFDMQYADKLFGLFQRLHSAAEFEGTGVGLANVQRMIHRHGGRTWAEGKVNEGATIYFSLPKERSASQNPEVSETDRPENRGVP